MTPTVKKALQWFADQPAPVALFSTVKPGVPSSSMRRRLLDRGLIEPAADQIPKGLIAYKISTDGQAALQNGDQPPRRLVLNMMTRGLCRKIGVKLNGQDMARSVTAYDVDAGTIKLVDGRSARGKVEPYWR